MLFGDQGGPFTPGQPPDEGGGPPGGGDPYVGDFNDPSRGALVGGASNIFTEEPSIG
jgi:hypothetical protein